MQDWQPTTLEDVKRYLEEGLAKLHPNHRMCFESIRVEEGQVPVDDAPGEYVYVVAQVGERLLYWSDVEDGWELDALSPSGGIATRGCNQFELSHVMHQVFGNPDH